MKRFVEGESRQQVTLLPECLDDYIGEDNPVRIVYAFVEELDLLALGFGGADPAATGRPAYHPGVLLKLYIYGYLNRIQSSRRLEHEAQRNVELMWLIGRLAPDFETIADFRHNIGRGIRNVCRRFVGLCRELKRFSQAIAAIDGSKFTSGKIEVRQRQIEQSIQRYLDALDTADRTKPAQVQAKTERLTDKIKTLREQMRRIDRTEKELQHEPGGQRSTTDPDACSMNSQAKGTGLVGYNVQAAVDAKHLLIVAQEVANICVDRASTPTCASHGRKKWTRGSSHLHWISACPKCPIKEQCTPSDYRRIRRWEHEDVLERVQKRLDRKLDAMTVRRRTVEHVFGTLKQWMGTTHFLTKTLTP